MIIHQHSSDIFERFKMDMTDEELFKLIASRIPGSSINDRNWYASINIRYINLKKLRISKLETFVDLKIPIINIGHKETKIPPRRGTPIRLIDVEKSFYKNSIVTVQYSLEMEYTSVSHPSSSDIMKISYKCAEMSGTYEQQLEKHVTKLGGLKKSRAIKHLLNDLKVHGVQYCWIDALCINQSNADEVSLQIMSMASIYSIAKQTVVYTRYIGTIQKILDSNKILGRWFSRVWTFQEAFFCRNPLVAVSCNRNTKYIDAKVWYLKKRTILNQKAAWRTRKLSEIARQMSRLNTSFGHLCGPASSVTVLESDVLIETADRGCKYHVDRINGIIGSLSVPSIIESFHRSEEINDLYYATEQLMKNCDYKLCVFMLCCPRLQALPRHFKSWLPTLGDRLKLSVLYKNPEAVIGCVINDENVLVLKTYLPHIGCIIRIEDRMPRGMCTCKITVVTESTHNSEHIDVQSNRHNVHTYIGDVIFDCKYEPKGCVISNNEHIATLDTECRIDKYVDSHAYVIPICFNDKPQERGDMKRCNALLLEKTSNSSTFRKVGILSIPTTIYLEAANVTYNDIIQGLGSLAGEYVFYID